MPILCYRIGAGIPKANIFDEFIAGSIVRYRNDDIKRRLKVSKMKVAMELIAYTTNHRNLHMISCKYLRRSEDKIVNLVLFFLKMNVYFSKIRFMNPRISIHIRDKNIIWIKPTLFPICLLKMFNTPTNIWTLPFCLKRPQLMSCVSHLLK